jgi:hypothetical protein
MNRKLQSIINALTYDIVYCLNEIYLQNEGDITIFWDVLFGFFAILLKSSFQYNEYKTVIWTMSWTK